MKTEYSKLSEPILCECGNEYQEFTAKCDTFLFCNKCNSHRSKQLPDGHCCRNPDVIFVNMPRKDAAPLKRFFCKNCGDYKQTKMSYPTEWKDLPLVSVKDADLMQSERSNKRRGFYEWVLEKKQASLEAKNKAFWRDYNAYLKTDEWAYIRSKVLKRDGNLCQCCLEERAQQVHHKTYENVFNENMFELISVCIPCHSKLHNRDLSYNFNYDSE